MYIIDSGVMVLNYKGDLEKSKISMLISTVVSYGDAMESSSARAVAFTFKEVDKIDVEALPFLVKEMERIESKFSMPIGIIDYTHSTYEKLKLCTKSTSINLFKNLDLAKLFLVPNKNPKPKKILVYDDDEDNQDKLCSALTLKGHTCVREDNPEALKKILQNSEFDAVVMDSSLGEKRKKQSSLHLSLSRKVVQNLPIFTDNAVNTLSSLTGYEAKKVSHAVKVFNKDISFDIVASVMSFSGDVKGKFVLVFPKTLALKTIESMLGEKIEESDFDALQDGVGEFCNIITGGAKTSLSNKDISVIFDLPKMFMDKNTLASNIGTNPGVWIDMNLDDVPFYMFIVD